MDTKTPLRLKLKLGNGGCSTPESLSPGHPTIINKMADDEQDQIGSDEEPEFDDDWQDDQLGDDACGEEEDCQFNKPQSTSHEDGSSRERHKKSKKKKKKKERERERQKHKHQKEKSELDDEEPPAKKLLTHFVGQQDGDSKLALAALKDVMLALLEGFEKRDTQQFFGTPVTDAIAPGYSSIITQPMDFSTMRTRLQQGEYTFPQFQEHVLLIFKNCMLYNQPDTIYYRAAKKLHHTADKQMSPHRMLAFKKDYPAIATLTKEQLGFDIEVAEAEAAAARAEDGAADSSNSKSDTEATSHDEQNSGEDEASAEDALEQSQRAAEEAAERLTMKKPASALGFLRQRVDGTTTLNFVTGTAPPAAEGSTEKPLTLGLITGKVTHGTAALQNFRDDKRSTAKPVKPLYYGTFSSFCPSYDSTFANLSKEESEMVYATYGNETAVQYAESICDFSKDCDMAMHLVDQLLDLLTHQQHSRTKALIEERRRCDEHKSLLAATTSDDASSSGSGTQATANFTPNFAALRTLKDVGIDTSFLNALERVENRERAVEQKLNENATLLSSLAREQRERLSRPLPASLNNLPPPSNSEVKLAEKVTEGLVCIARQVPPGSLAPVPIVRRALGIGTMPPNAEQSADHIEVDIEETSSRGSTPPPLAAPLGQAADRKLREMLSSN